MSNVLTKRAGTTLVRFIGKRAKYAPRYRTAMALGKFAWQNRARIYKGARQIRRGIGRFRRIQRNQIANFQTATSRRQLTNQNAILNLASRVLYASDILQNINQGFEPNDRDKDSIKLAGFKIWYNASNIQATPVWMNLAIVSPKEVNAVTTTNFFRSIGADRGYDFGTALSSVEIHMRAINTDLYTVLAHRRIFLGENPVGNANDSSNQLRQIYVPIKRTMRYQNVGAVTSPLEKLFFVYWCDLNNSPQGTVATTGVVSFIWQCAAYFRNTKA